MITYNINKSQGQNKDSELSLMSAIGGIGLAITLLE